MMDNLCPTVFMSEINGDILIKFGIRCLHQTLIDKWNIYGEQEGTLFLTTQEMKKF
jgi:hypothetical protein